MNRKSEEDVKISIEQLGYKFIGPYTTNRSIRVACKCGCGTELTMSYDKLKLGRGCQRVNQSNRSRARRTSIDQVIPQLVDKGFTYLEGEYINSNSKLHLQCRCGHYIYASLAYVRKSKKGCINCCHNPENGGNRHSIDHVRDTFSLYGCLLLDTAYINNRQQLSFICSCGQTSKKSYCEIVKSKGGCRHCKDDRISKKHLLRFSTIPKVTEEHKRNQARLRHHHLTDTNPQYRIRNCLRQLIRGAVFRVKGKNSNRSMNLVGCSIEEYMIHLQSKFQPGMTWENYGAYRLDGPRTWHIDHIIPCASFDLTDPEEQKKCFHWSNTQPLWADENLSKSNRSPDGKRMVHPSRKVTKLSS